MIINKNNIVKIALVLQQKQVLLKNEKLFLKYFSIIKFLVNNNFCIDLNTISLSIIKQLKIIKKPIKIKQLKTGEFYTNNFCFNVFCGNLKNVIISKSGYIKIYENNTYKFLSLLVAGQNVFLGSRVNNYPNKTIIFNKQFTLKIYTAGNKVIFSCNKIIDNFTTNYFFITIAYTSILTFSNAGLAALNLLLLNTCKQVKFAREAKLNGKNEALCFCADVFDANSMQNYINLISASQLLNFLEKPIYVNPIILNNFASECKTSNQQIILRKTNMLNTVVVSSTFFSCFVNSVFYANCLLNYATFKLPLMLGEHKIIFMKSGIKIVNLTENHTFYISTNCKIKSAQILNGELLCELAGDIKLCIANTSSTWRENTAQSQSTLIKLERLFLNNIVKTLFALKNSFYELTKIDNVFYNHLKQIIKAKQSLRYASQMLIKLSSTAKDETELKKLFKLSGLINSLPEKKVNLSDLSNRSIINLSELEQLTIEEQLELYKIKQQNPLVKNTKVC